MSKLFVPNEILRVFKSLYPEIAVQDVEWSWEVPGKIYEAEFSLGDQEFEVEITVTGHHLLTETTIKHAIPQVVRDTVSHFYPDHAINSSSLVAYSNDDICYELDLVCAAKGTEFEVLIREDGLFLMEGVDL